MTALLAMKSFQAAFGFECRRDWCCMKEEQYQFLALVGQAPARLTVEQAAWMIGCQAHDMPILVSSRLLKPLGNPAQNGIKFFATADVLELIKDRSWLAKMTSTVNQHWHRKNARKKNCASDGLAPVLDLTLAATR
jgi:hypothetical protein